MTESIGPWPLGIDMLSPDTAMPSDRDGNVIAARDCVDGDFNRVGQFASRPGLLKVGGEALHSLWTRRDGSASYAVRGNELVQVVRTDAGMTTIAVAQLAGSNPVDFCELNGEVIYSSLDELGAIAADGSTRPLCVPDAATPGLAESDSGGLYAGRYSVAYAWVNARGVEGALSPLATIKVHEGKGIRITIPHTPAGATAYRIYRTGQNGNVLYLTAEAPASLTSYLIGTAERGRQADNAYLRAMRPGVFVRAWRGRLLTARGRFLYLSEPMRYGLYSPRHGFVQFPTRITFIEAVEGGVFVGQQDTVLFLDGATPGDWTQQRTGGARPVPHSSLLVSPDLFSAGLELPSGDHALWLAANGYVLGSPTGQLVEAQARRIRLPDAAAGWTAVHDRRLFTMTT